MDYRFLLAKSIEMAAKAHGNVLSKDDTTYILHPLRLMMSADSYAEKIVAVLYDTVEDTPLILRSFVDEGFPPEIVNAIDALTKREGEDYEVFIERIAFNPLAVKVKLLDLYDNTDVTRLPELGEWELKRTAKYHRAITRLEETFNPQAVVA